MTNHPNLSEDEITEAEMCGETSRTQDRAQREPTFKAQPGEAGSTKNNEECPRGGKKNRKMLYTTEAKERKSTSRRMQSRTASLQAQSSRPMHQANGRVVTIMSNMIEYLLYILDTALSNLQETHLIWSLQQQHWLGEGIALV